MPVGDETITTSWGSILQALTDEHRRRLLVALLEKNPQADTVEIPEDVHVGESELEVLNAKMYHQHLPTLEAAGFIKWDQEANEVVKGPKFDEIRPLVELVHNHREELPEGWV